MLTKRNGFGLKDVFDYVKEQLPQRVVPEDQYECSVISYQKYDGKVPASVADHYLHVSAHPASDSTAARAAQLGLNLGGTSQPMYKCYTCTQDNCTYPPPPDGFICCEPCTRTIIDRFNMLNKDPMLQMPPWPSPGGIMFEADVLKTTGLLNIMYSMRVDADMKNKPKYPDMCPCQIKSVMCDYHRGL